jgi:predicted GNAT family acetyltransferase
MVAGGLCVTCVRVVKVVECESAATMWRDAEALLCGDAANNTQLLGAITRLIERGAHRGERFFTVRDGLLASVVGAAIRVESHTLFCSEMSADAARFLARYLRSHDAALAGISGRTDALNAFTEAFGAAHHVHNDRMLYALRGEPNFGRAPGELRAVTLADIELLSQWYRAFEIEADIVPAETPLEQRVRMSILESAYSFWVVDGVPVAMAGARKLPAASARIGPVYTPPELRGRGYAQALTAAASEQVQHDGPRTVFLFTDASNPASNKAYQRIGFVHIADHTHVLFDAQQQLVADREPRL